MDKKESNFRSKDEVILDFKKSYFEISSCMENIGKN